MPERRGRKHEKLEPPRAIVCFYEDFNRAAFPIKLTIITSVARFRDSLEAQRAKEVYRNFTHRSTAGSPCFGAAAFIISGLFGFVEIIEKLF
jgi:hypothetical protein